MGRTLLSDADGFGVARVGRTLLSDAVDFALKGFSFRHTHIGFLRFGGALLRRTAESECPHVSWGGTGKRNARQLTADIGGVALAVLGVVPDGIDVIEDVPLSDERSP